MCRRDLAEVLHIAGQLEAQHRAPHPPDRGHGVPGHAQRWTDQHADGSGVAQVLKVRLIHATIRHLILHGEPAQGRVPGFASSTGTERSNGRAGRTARRADGAWLGRGAQRGLPCNQLELAYTLLTFHYVFLQRHAHHGPRAFALADEAAFLHAWNVAGHVLGVQRRT
jgi:hypothetical protein